MVMNNTVIDFPNTNRNSDQNTVTNYTEDEHDVVAHAKRIQYENEMLRLEIAKSICAQAGYKAQIDALLSLHAA